jgi:SAM-dependent methyltransferase
MFRGVTLELEDLYLLESFQIAYLPGWAPERELAGVLWSTPALNRFLARKCPPVADFLNGILAQHPPISDPEELETATQRVLWTIEDLLVYNKCPEVYDALEFHNWDFTEVTSVVSLDGKSIIDSGAGTGRVALEAALSADSVFAVEPVTRLRQFIRDKAAETGLTNVFVIDGFNHAIPLPNSCGDVLITSHALGWRLEDELQEFERVVKKGGTIIHCPGTACRSGEEEHLRLVSSDWGCAFATYEEADGTKRKYWKHL